MKRTLLTALIGWSFGLIVFIAAFAYGFVRIPSAYKTKAVCSEVFVADRDLDNVLDRDFARIHPVMDRVRIKVDPQAQSVRGSLFGILGRVQVDYRPGYGCSIVVDGEPYNEPFKTVPIATQPWKVEIDPTIQALTEAARLSAKGDVSADVRALLVVQNGVIVAEDYADDFGPDVPMQSWSMAKSVTQAMAAIAIDQGLLSLSDRELMPDWKGGDPRAEITLANLLQMTDGLDFVEDYADPNSSVSSMLFNSRHMGLTASKSELAYEPGKNWTYSSGTTNILSAVLRRAIEGSGQDYHSWPYQYLFAPIGMGSPVFETDAGGTFIGSSYLYATARDWARLGQLYLDGGMWNGQRVLPEGAVRYATTPVSSVIDFYGAQWWLNTEIEGEGVRLPGLPDTAYYMGGHDVQRVIVIPSKNAVIVRLGMTRPPIDDQADVGPAIAAIYDAL
ncbi:MAG: serine hydrolase [Pseudomonadota bacterium]